MSDDPTTDWLFAYYDRAGMPIEGNNFAEYGRLVMDPAYKFVAKTTVGDAEVSTVWLGMNHAFRPDVPPLIFETMVFGGKHDDLCERYSTEAEALAGHAAVVRRVVGLRFWLQPKDVLAERIAGVA